jgi:hypothetical protein
MSESTIKPSVRFFICRGAYTICFLFMGSILIVAMNTLAGALGGTFLSYVTAVALIGAITILSLFVLIGSEKTSLLRDSSDQYAQVQRTQKAA